MNAIITKDGGISMNRNGAYKDATCPFQSKTSNNVATMCGDDCPLLEIIIHPESKGHAIGEAILNCGCNKVFLEITRDDRVKSKENEEYNT